MASIRSGSFIGMLAMTHAAEDSPGVSDRRSRLVKAFGLVAGAAGMVGAIVANFDKVTHFTCEHFDLLCAWDPNPKGKVASSYICAFARFVRSGRDWTEYNSSNQPKFHFITSSIDDEYVYIVDKTRTKNGEPDRPLTIRIPLRGGMSDWGFPNPYDWQPLYGLTPA